MTKLSLTLDPRANFASDCAAAGRLGFDAAVVDPGPGANRFDAPATRRTMIGAGLGAGGLHQSLTWSGGLDPQFAGALRGAIDRAAELGCEWAGPLLGRTQIGRTASSATAAFRDSLLPVEERARSCGVRLLLGNDGLFASARQLWAILDQLPRDTFGCDWGLGPGNARGDTPAIVIPMLNRRLGCVELDSTVDDRTAARAAHRLAGIGYGGFLNFAAGGVAINDAAFAVAVQKIRGLIGAPRALAGGV